GVEITKEALSSLVGDSETRRIEINWQRTNIDFNPYKRWVDLWREE
ncbi:MAG: ThaI family type II restriction endonuclease, partial [candidate division Zixibacteria bacterium]|nr:ThaI family type II restriction endonuclease [candidate division Zixibacteria bacterium]